jgi:uncharacterized membrane protein
MSVRNGGLTATLRQRTIYLAILIIFAVGALAGSFLTYVRTVCDQLALEQKRTVAFFAILSETAEKDGAVASSAALRAYAEQAAEAQRPNC